MLAERNSDDTYSVHLTGDEARQILRELRRPDNNLFLPRIDEMYELLSNALTTPGR